jgi:putative nucleotidyltransferase with HDIG domain
MDRNRVFRDPVHGLIELTGRDRELTDAIDSRAFQRLRRIRQLGFARLVYPGAEHSRFGHALGAYHVARRIADSLGLDDPVATHVRVAALLHDIGHGPFSHAWEEAFDQADHESWGARIVTEDEQLRRVLERIDPQLPETLCGFWTKTYEPSYARKLVSSQLDCDRLDYLLRDGHYSGAGYATYDLDWILYALRIGDVGEDRQDLVVDYRRGMHAVEQYLFARSYMYAQVYHHKTVRAAEWMFLKLMQRFGELTRRGEEPAGLATCGRLARGEHIEVADYLSLDDNAVTAAADRWALDGPDPVLRDLARRLRDRRLFKTIDLGNDASVVERVKDDAERIARDQFGDDAASYLQLDRAEQIGYSAKGTSEELHVVGHPVRGTVSLGTLLADMRLGQPVSRIRIVCAPELVDRLRPIADAAL